MPGAGWLRADASTGPFLGAERAVSRRARRRVRRVAADDRPAVSICATRASQPLVLAEPSRSAWARKRADRPSRTNRRWPPPRPAELSRRHERGRVALAFDGLPACCAWPRRSWSRWRTSRSPATDAGRASATPATSGSSSIGPRATSTAVPHPASSRSTDPVGPERPKGQRRDDEHRRRHPPRRRHSEQRERRRLALSTTNTRPPTASPARAPPRTR